MPHTRNSQPAVPAPDGRPLVERLADASAQWGEEVIAARAVSLMAGEYEGEGFLLLVGGDHAQGILDGAPPLYWPELWGTRALLHVWDDSAAPAVVSALSNPAWRVREMAARVVAARGLEARAELIALLEDDKPRVRSAAARALSAVGIPEDLDNIRPLLRDPLIEVRRSAQQSRDALRARFPKAPATEV